jgi:hypothetical protein
MTAAPIASTTVFVTMSTSHSIHNGEIALPILVSYAYTYLSVVTSIEDLPPATPTSWPYSLTHTMLVDRIDITASTFGNLRLDDTVAAPCPQTTVGTSHLGYALHTTFVHHRRAAATHLPAGVTAHADSPDVVPCSADVAAFEPDAECAARGAAWDTACLGQCPAVGGEFVCRREWMGPFNQPREVADGGSADGHRWAVGDLGRVCWEVSGETRRFSVLNKPCLKGDHWVGCAPGKGIDSKWRPNDHDNSGLVH